MNPSLTGERKVLMKSKPIEKMDALHNRSIFFHLNKQAYVSFYRTEAILLDLKKDKYIVLDSERSKLLEIILDNKFLPVEGGYSSAQAPIVDTSTLNQFIHVLRNQQILDRVDHPSPYSVVIDKKKDSIGVSNIDWRLSDDDMGSFGWNKEVFVALWVLIKVHFAAKFRGFYGLIQQIRKQHRHRTIYVSPDRKDIKSLTEALNIACTLYPTRTKCLEWATAFTLLSLRKGWRCSLVIGVQNNPFMAHAWAEVNDIIVADSQELREHLALILKEPFSIRSHP